MSFKRGTLLYMAAIYLAFCFPSEEAVAEELVIQEQATLGVPTLVCDRIEEVMEVFGLAEMFNIQEAVQQVEGCGWLNKPAVARVVAIGTFETDKHKYLLVRFDFLEMEVPPQYSVAAIKVLNKV